MKLNPYVCLPGTAAAAVDFYKTVFKTEPEAISRFSDVPASAGLPPPSSTGALRIMHASFKLGTDQLMISDAPEGQDNTIVMGSQTQISIHPDSKEEADRLHTALKEGGEEVMAMVEAFWGDYFGMVKDKFGVRWMINYRKS